MKLKIMIDSASDLTQKEAQDLGVLFMPIEVRFEDEEYLDGINLMPEEFFEKLEKSSSLPKTSLINEYRWQEAFENATKDGSELLVLSLSSGLSGGYNAAKQAAEKFNGKVQVVDTLSATIGERLLLNYAITLAKKDLSLNEVADLLNAAKAKLNITAFVGTLKYLKMGGRISGTAAVVGEMLKIMPLIAVIDGKVKNIGKAMGTKKASVQIRNIVRDKGINFNMPFCLVYSGENQDNLNVFKKECSCLWEENTAEIPVYKIGSTIGTHVGPGAVGIAYFEL